MAQLERYDVLVLGSGTGGKLIAWHMAQSGKRTAAIERKWIGGACPNVACLPSRTRSQARGSRISCDTLRNTGGLSVPEPSI